MKKQSKTTIIKLSERFDKQLLNILSKELNALKSTKDNIIKTLRQNSDDGLQVDLQNFFYLRKLHTLSFSLS